MKILDVRWLCRNLISFIWNSRVATTSHILLTTSLSHYWILDHLITVRACGVLHENSYMYLIEKKKKTKIQFKVFFAEMWPRSTIKTDEIIISSNDDRARSGQRIANEQRCVTIDICSEWWDDGRVQHDNTHRSFFFFLYWRAVDDIHSIHQGWLDASRFMKTRPVTRKVWCHT